MRDFIKENMLLKLVGVFCAFAFIVACSDTNVAGCTEEPNACGVDNNIAEADLSSSSNEESSSSKNKSSSSSDKASSSSAKSSSSSDKLSSSSEETSSSSIESSSSSDKSSSSSVVISSSSSILVIMSSSGEYVEDDQGNGVSNKYVKFPSSISKYISNKPSLPEIIFLDSTRQIEVMWNGGAKDYRVDTKFDNGSNTSGYWYDFNDSDDGGKSRIEWPSELGNSIENRFDAVIDYCQGLCGTAWFSGAKPSDSEERAAGYVGVDFYVVGKSLELMNGINTENSRGFADVTKWDGLCVEYSSDVTLAIRLDPGDSLRSQIMIDSGADDLPYISLRRTLSSEGISDTVTGCVEWKNFYQWEEEKTMTGLEAAKHLAAIEFKVTGKVNSANFLIRSISWMKLREKEEIFGK